MDWRNAINEIESLEVDVRLNVVSSFSRFLKAARREPAVLALHQKMQESGEVSEEVLGRIYELSTEETDPLYENPRDTSLAILLWLLFLKQMTHAKIAAHRVAGTPNCHYARKVVALILAPIPAPLTSGGMRIDQTENKINEVLSGSDGQTIYLDQLFDKNESVRPKVANLINNSSDLGVTSGGGGLS